jgi:cobalt-zinc-cadmium efflux system outer membrane protein
VKSLPLIGTIVALTGCAHFESKPISPSESAVSLETRSLTNAEVKIFLEKNLNRDLANWPAITWDLNALTLAAFYYHPDLAVARAQWQVAQAGIKTAGGHPNPTLSLVPGYSNPTEISPWIPGASFDLPIETAHKRRHRIDAAEQLTQSARFNFASASWRVRSALRSSLVDLDAAGQRALLLQQQLQVQEQIVALLDQQVKAGAISESQVSAFRIALQKLRLDFATAQTQRVEAQGRLAEAIGVPSKALTAIKLPGILILDRSNANELVSADVRRTALQSRSDILAALADYASAEAALKLEIAKQYPDVHISPGYQFDQGDNKWTLGFTFELPILNQNQGPIAEAEARRVEAAAHFNATQAKALAEIDQATEVYRVSQSTLAPLQSLATEQATHRDAAEAQFKAGMLDPIDLLNAKLEFVAAELTQLEGLLKVQQAIGALEDAMQRPLDLPGSSLPDGNSQRRASGSQEQTADASTRLNNVR